MAFVPNCGFLRYETHSSIRSRTQNILIRAAVGARQGRRAEIKGAGQPQLPRTTPLPDVPIQWEALLHLIQFANEVAGAYIDYLRRPRTPPIVEHSRRNLLDVLSDRDSFRDQR